MEILLNTIKFMNQILLLFPFQLFMGVLQKAKTNTIILSAGRLYKVETKYELIEKRLIYRLSKKKTVERNEHQDCAIASFS
jgi:hypothetical protein